MTYRALPVHRTIVAVDVEAFGARGRTNRDQVAVRDGLYCATQEAFREAGIPWADCDHEDRGDGMIVLVGPEVPKSLFVESLPVALADALRKHNGGHPEMERIRLRMALHAGEVNYDEHGATATAINLTFRLLESDAVKKALADSASVLAVIASSWFFQEVVRHSTADAAAYHPVPVAVKETVATGWIWLAGHGSWSGSEMPWQLPSATSAGDQVAARSAARPGDALALPYRAALADPEVSGDEPAMSADSGLPVTVPLGRLPADVRGRDGLLAELRRALVRKPRERGGTWVLAGMGGLGKSTVALAAAKTAQARGWQVWWVTAADAASLTGGMLEVLHQLSAPEPVTRPVRQGSPLAAERTWAYLNEGHLRGRWLLIFDNVDTPAVLAASGTGSPADYAGWLRPDPPGMVIITTRTKDPRVWGPRVNLRELRPLDDATAARVLADLAPGVHDPDRSEATDLGRRLGGLPLALHLAGTCLSSPFARWHSFADYRRALDGTGLPDALADLDDLGSNARSTIRRTWDLSLDALAADGRPQARPLLSVLSCYAPATLIPGQLLKAEPLAGMLEPAGRGLERHPGNPEAEHERRLRAGLQSLAAVGLIDVVGGDKAVAAAVLVHPVVADASRARLLTTAHPDLPVISQWAVQLLVSAARDLDDQLPADWPVWRLLTPHVSALLGWLAGQRESAALVTLLGISDRTARALLSAGNYALAEKLAISGAAAAALLGDDHPANLTARHILGRSLAAQGRNIEAEFIYRKVLTGQQRVLGGKHPDTLTNRGELAWVIEYQGRFDEAEQMYRQLLADSQQVLGDDAPLALNARRHLAVLTAIGGDYADAERQFRCLLADRVRVLGNEHPDTLDVGSRFAWAISLQGRTLEAEQCFRQVLAMQQRVIGDAHPDTIDTRYRLARVITDLGRYDEAEELYRYVLSDRRRVQGDDHPATLTVRDYIARLTGLQGRYEKAERLFIRSLADRRQKIGEEHAHTLTTRHRLAWVIAEQGRYGEAEQMFREVLTDRVRILGDDHPNTLSTRRRLAQVIVGQGRYNEARQLLRQVLADSGRVLGPDHPDTASTRNELARIPPQRG
jgi:tetratricopeptide (TPR) repeat protein